MKTDLYDAVQEDRFVDLWERNRTGNEGRSGHASDIFSDICRHYSEAHRRYHTLEHVHHCLRHYDTACSVLGRSDAVELGIWFHDVIYQLGADDNERNSADWFLSLSAGELEPGLAADVERLIMATLHQDSPQRQDECFLTDIDLASFGLPWPGFLHDGSLVRQEAVHLNDAEYRRGHRVFLQNLLDRPRIYGTDFFYDRMERTARFNIQRKFAISNSP